mgnify:FL=1
MPDLFALGSTDLPGFSKIVEETGELMQVIGMYMQTRGSDLHWKGDLRPMLIDELADVVNSIQFFKAHNLTAEEKLYFQRRILQKRKLFESWHHGENKL